MKFVANLKAFREALSEAAAAVPSRSPKEILYNVRVMGTGNSITLLGTNAELSVERTCDADVLSSGMFLLPTSRTTQILATLTSETVQIEGDEAKVRILGGRAKFELATADPQDFPGVTDFEATETISVSSTELAAGFRKTVFACDEKSARFALGGVLLDTKAGVTLVATDTKRMSVINVALNGGSGNSPVIPAKAVHAVIKCLSDDPPEFTDVRIGANLCSFDCGNSVVTTRLVEGRFPNYRNVIPKSPEMSVALVAGPLLEVVRQAQNATSEESAAVHFNFSEGLLRLTGQCESANADSEIPVPWTHGDFTVLFDPKYVADMLKILPSDAIVMCGFTDAETATLLSCGTWNYVVMPLSKDGL